MYLEIRNADEGALRLESSEITRTEQIKLGSLLGCLSIRKGKTLMVVDCLKAFQHEAIGSIRINWVN